MEKPQKPDLEMREREGRHGEIVVELTPESENRWAEYLRQMNFYRMAMGALSIEQSKHGE
jgi:hypothetical protein